MLFGKLSNANTHGEDRRSLEALLKAFTISRGTRENEAQGMNVFHSAINEHGEAIRIHAAEMRMQFRSGKKTTISELGLQLATSIICPLCQRTIQSQIGLINHLRAHRPIITPTPTQE